MRTIRIILFLLLSYPTLLCNAQSNQHSKLDSLYRVWLDDTKSDTVRVRAFTYYIMRGFMYSHPDSAFRMAQQMVRYSEGVHYKQGIANGLNIQGITYYLKGNYIEALNYYNRSLKLNEELGNKRGISIDLNNIGNVFIIQGNTKKAIGYYNRGLTIDEELDDKEGLAVSLVNLGGIYLDQGDYEGALSYFIRGLKLAEETGNKHYAAAALINIGNVYKEQANYFKALDHYHRCMELAESITHNRLVGTALLNIGDIYKRQGDYDKAIEYLDRSLLVYEKLEDTKGIAGSLYMIGKIYQTLVNFDKAREYCERSLILADSVGALLSQKDACECLYDTYKKMGNSIVALEYLERLQTINDSLKVEETSKKLAQMEFAEQQLKDSLAEVEKDRRVAEAHQEEIRKKNRTRNIYMVSGLFTLILAGSFVRRWYYVRKSKAIIEKEKDRSENLLLNILPAEIAEELKEKGRADARKFDRVTILFTDFKHFTQASEVLSPEELVEEINTCFKTFDGICEKHGIEKIKTIGDSYMAAGGLPVPSDDSVKNTVLAGLAMAEFIVERKAILESEGKFPFEMRAGINTGPVVAGIVGVKKFQYDIWGDTVNTASRMESSGEVGKVNISESTYDLIKDEPEFLFEHRGQVEAKGKGLVEMYFVSLKQ